MPPAHRACRRTPSRRRHGLRLTASWSLPSEHPEERDLALGLTHPHELVEHELEPGLANEPAVRLGVEGGEEHLDPEPLVRPVGTAHVAERREEQPVRLQPAGDPTEQRWMT